MPQPSPTDPSATASTTTSAGTALATPPLGRHFEAGGRQLLLHRSGIGGPTVVFLAGSGAMSLDYLNIHDRVAELTRSVLYDRAGNGWSDPVALPRTAAEVTDELRELLRAAALPGPYVLVGHSLGGAYARHYARRFPGEVAGLLLLDPFHESMLSLASEQIRAKLTELHDSQPPEPTDDQLHRAREALGPTFANWPQEVREPLIERHLATWRSGLAEGRNLYVEVAEELRQAPPLPDIPLIVLTAMGVDPVQVQLWSEETAREMNEGKHRLHAQLAAEVPRGEQRVLLDAGHAWLHEERQDAVLQAVGDLLGMVGR
ncbi:alpha/beta fold hydrolase [Kitasatospora sp. NPDC008050]|uniref:alpha/beta fold hydrolase n=1 Tax=Kitasatospora sp. NPDC008050 TaxID=3364021 RepID=UPI0036E67367